MDRKVNPDSDTSAVRKKGHMTLVFFVSVSHMGDYLRKEYLRKK